ncbi:MAG: hypothetical protein CMG64_03130, partial [Candidatus Marinimicrobia bacterium]|nr:hypothetical protein [Candidatus Neomarinimicrobiota bacterium]
MISSTANLSTEDKRTYSKIKKLIVSRDTDQIDLGVELAVSLNNSSIFSSLLAGCKIEGSQNESTTVGEYASTKLVTNKLFTGSGPAQPFLNYALMSLIANVPDNDEIEIDESIKIKNIKELDLYEVCSELWHGWEDQGFSGKTPDITNFTHLQKLNASSNWEHAIQFKSSNIKELGFIIGESCSLEFLSGFPKLEYLDISMSMHIDHKIECLESFKNLVSLRELILSPGNMITDIDFLSECNKLEKLKIDLGTDYSRATELADISSLSNLKNLEELDITCIHSRLPGDDICKLLSPIGDCKKLKKLSLNGNDVDLDDISFLDSCNELSDLAISGFGEGYS